jgi:hypothetical protein
MGYPPPPPTAPSGKIPLRGRVPLRLGIVLLVVGLALVISGGVVGFSAGLGKVDHFTRVRLAQGQATVQLSSGSYVGYYEAPGFDTGGNVVPIVGLQLADAATGTPVDVGFYGNRSDNKITKLTYDYHGHHGAALYQFRIATSGRYTATLTRRSADVAADSDLALGSSIANGLAVGGVLAVIGLLALVAGIVLLIIGLVKRSRSRGELAGSGYYYGGQAGPTYSATYPGPPGSYPPPQGHPQQPQGYPAPQQAYPPQQGYPPPSAPHQPYPGGSAYPPPGYGQQPPAGSAAEDEPPWPPRER